MTTFFRIVFVDNGNSHKYDSLDDLISKTQNVELEMHDIPFEFGPKGNDIENLAAFANIIKEISNEDPYSPMRFGYIQNMKTKEIVLKFDMTSPLVYMVINQSRATD